jgi:hypothetical protein
VAKSKLVELMLLRRRGLGNTNSNANMASSGTADSSDSGDNFTEHEGSLLEIPETPTQ